MSLDLPEASPQQEKASQLLQPSKILPHHDRWLVAEAVTACNREEQVLEGTATIAEDDCKVSWMLGIEFLAQLGGMLLAHIDPANYIGRRGFFAKVSNVLWKEQPKSFALSGRISTIREVPLGRSGNVMMRAEAKLLSGGTTWITCSDLAIILTDQRQSDPVLKPDRINQESVLLAGFDQPWNDEQITTILESACGRGWQYIDQFYLDPEDDEYIGLLKVDRLHIEGHRPPVLPGNAMLLAFVQTALLAIKRQQPDVQCVFPVSLNHIKWHEPTFPGEQIRFIIECWPEDFDKTMWHVEGRAKVGSEDMRADISGLTVRAS